jgi:hypothetical protein
MLLLLLLKNPDLQRLKEKIQSVQPPSPPWLLSYLWLSMYVCVFVFTILDVCLSDLSLFCLLFLSLSKQTQSKQREDNQRGAEVRIACICDIFFFPVFSLFTLFSLFSLFASFLSLLDSLHQN